MEPGNNALHRIVFYHIHPTPSLFLLEIRFRRTLLFISKFNIMEDLLYVVAVILIIAWLIGFLGYSAGGLIHILLVIAVIAIILRVIRGNRVL